MARPQKSAKATELAGTARADRPRTEPLAAIPLQHVPDPLDWLEGHDEAIKLWRWLAPLLVTDGLLATKDLQTLGNLCIVQSRIIRHARGEPVDLRGSHALYAKYAAALGLAAGWRARVASNAEKDKADKNPFAAFKSGDRTN